ncbi:MAG TPA: glutamate formimidoyltransferase [Clostridiaceae bacterium]|nr:glutamate formimidoyltransferase [Clostridiaceae bacterium]
MALIESVPNFSCTGETLEAIVALFQKHEGITVLDFSSDEDHNRSVVTVIGAPDPLSDAVFEAIKLAADTIDLREHKGAHPRMGATDVVPFIPIAGATMDDCIELSRRLGERVGRELGIPVFLYEKSASSPERSNLAVIRKGQFEGMAEKMRGGFAADFGPDTPHVSAGVTAIGARKPLLAFNVNLGTADLSVADRIAKKIRFLGGGLRYVKAMGVLLENRGITQVSMNLTDYEQSSLYQVVETIRFEAARYGVSVIGSELIGLAPMQAILDAAAYYLQLETFSAGQIIESHLLPGKGGDAI